MDSTRKPVVALTGGGYLFSVNDLYGNPVVLTNDTWNHVTLHPDMSGLLKPVKSAVSSPSMVFRSASSDNRLVLHGSNLLLPRPNIVRVVVEYEDIEAALVGQSLGDVVTAFAPSPANEFKGALGEIIYQRPHSSKKKGKRR